MSIRSKKFPYSQLTAPCLSLRVKFASDSSFSCTNCLNFMLSAYLFVSWTKCLVRVVFICTYVNSSGGLGLTRIFSALLSSAPMCSSAYFGNSLSGILLNSRAQSNRLK